MTGSLNTIRNAISKEPKGTFEDFAMLESRFNLLKRTKPELADKLFALAQKDIEERLAYYKQLASVTRK